MSKLIKAQNEAEVRRAAFLTSADTLKARVAPARLGKDALDKTVETGTAIADGAVAEVKSKPWLYGGLAAAALLFLARKPVGKLAVGAYDRIAGGKSEEDLKDDALELEAPDSPIAVARRAKRVAPTNDKTVENEE